MDSKLQEQREKIRIPTSHELLSSEIPLPRAGPPDFSSTLLGEYVLRAKASVLKAISLFGNPWFLPDALTPKQGVNEHNWA